MANRSKKHWLQNAAAHIKHLRPDLECHFLCPTCLKTFPIKQAERISEAHIIPEAAGGTLKTYICVNCNSTFGAKQDKWFGEYFRLKRTGKTPLHSRTVSKYFTIDGTKVRCKLFLEEESIGIGLLEDHNPPGLLDQIQNNLDSPSQHPKTIEFDIPLLGKEQLIKNGFLTAAYLMWFYAMGYSWVLQKHLSPIREQIMNPDEKVLEYDFVKKTNSVFFIEPQIGVLKGDAGMALYCGIADRLILFPPADRPGEVIAFDKKTSGSEFMTTQRAFELYDGKNYGPGLGLVVEDRALIWPDALPDNTDSNKVLHYQEIEAHYKLLSLVEIKDPKALGSAPSISIRELKYRIDKNHS